VFGCGGVDPNIIQDARVEGRFVYEHRPVREGAVLTQKGVIGRRLPMDEIDHVFTLLQQGDVKRSMVLYDVKHEGHRGLSMEACGSYTRHSAMC